MEDIAPAWELKDGESPETVLFHKGKLFVDNFKAEADAGEFVETNRKKRKLSICPFGVDIISVKEDGKVTEWERCEGFSVWEKI